MSHIVSIVLPYNPFNLAPGTTTSHLSLAICSSSWLSHPVIIFFINICFQPLLFFICWCPHIGPAVWLPDSKSPLISKCLESLAWLLIQHAVVVHCCTVPVHQLGVFASPLSHHHSANSCVLEEQVGQQHWNLSMCTPTGLSLKAWWVSSLMCAGIFIAHVACKRFSADT